MTTTLHPQGVGRGSKDDKSATTTLTIDGNEAVARMAYLGNEVIAIYPITPASNMGEWADEWASQGKPNLWGAVPKIIEMQSEAGAAGALHGALTTGALATSFTASQGLLLFIPNLYKIAGELTPFVLHVAARTLATHALSIFGDHSDVMACRATGCALLAANSPQEAQDLALIAQAATLAGRIPVIHFFDGFRTSHEVAKIVAVEADTVRAMLDADHIAAHRVRALSPEHPVLRGTSQNPDVFFQSRERVNPFYDAFPQIVQDGDGPFRRTHRAPLPPVRLRRRAGCRARDRAHGIRRRDRARDRGPPAGPRRKSGRAEGAAVPAAGCGCPAGCPAGQCKSHRRARPLQGAGRRRRAALQGCGDRAGAGGGRKHAQHAARHRWPLRSRQQGVHPRHGQGRVRRTGASLRPSASSPSASTTTSPTCRCRGMRAIRTDAAHKLQHAVFWGLGADGTVSANKNSIKIVGEATDLQAQGYFVYDSKKSGAVTVSHLRFGPAPIRSTYLVEAGMAGFVACHQPVFVERYDLLEHAAPDGVFLLNTPAAPDQVWDTLPETMRAQIRDKRLQFWAIDAYAVAAEAGMGRRINTIMQTCFFAISGILPKDEAIAAIKHAVDKTYGKKSKRLVELNYRAIDTTLAKLHQIAIPEERRQEGACARCCRNGCDTRYSRLRARSHPADLSGQGRSTAGIELPRGRHLSARHRAIREAQHRAGNPGMGCGPVHPVRQVRAGLSAYRHPRARLR